MNKVLIFLSGATEAFIKKYLTVRNMEFNELVCVDPCVFFRKTHPMAGCEVIRISEMQMFPYASFSSAETGSNDFAEEVILENIGEIRQRFSVADRATMINILTHTDAFSIGTGILSPGFAGPELVSRPIEGHKNEIHIGWIQITGMPLSETCELLIEKLKQTLNNRQ
ncbi:MAG: hypothetical protein GX684_01455 [Ruminococcaceae bacterium]|nr:hypothetical protein [Oscillospiraceae bacterium]